ncbi:hypothetical protein IMG5_100210 [Ichthyophthirius multifiliis]|uniref:Protein kinase domain-containing protein n=1 Tax=Ichthyophthirius multifiliis TaxID=5932 RepID=G0QSC5_ICHMU|nr:hypothetical protein IMG5_100210 [Ichthyophthirius multifiliis]EGR31872.1 hypothetical protein IMG5_100210 [Ichthyophthirius multifiliis]|eukprot:XP_004035358.1 hypothetical protein IMG5_100210 [Ichthyophthirius multifiliis]
MEYPSKAIPLNIYLKQQITNKLSEQESRNIFIQLIQAIKYCHNKQIIHRDIKLENILYDPNAQKVKLIDFGFSIAIVPGTMLNIFCGTPSYMAPEIVNKQDYSFSVDIWALGILLFKILNGKFPFKGKNDQDLYKKINECKLDFESDVSLKSRLLIQSILKQNPDDRININQILENDWINNIEKS